MLSDASDAKPFPVPLGVLSVWQRSTRGDPLINMGKDDPLPKEADVVIIGSGLCGAVTAFSLLSAEDRPKTVVMLEAREACSGASGRNAGHCRPDAYRGFTNFSRKHGEQDAMEILESERTVYELVDTFVMEHGVDCEWTPRPTFDVCLSEEFTAYSNIAYDNVMKRGGAKEVTLHTGDDAPAVTRVGDATKAFEWPAATLNPAKLCYAVHRMSLEKGGYSIFTHTPALSVTESADSNGSWTVNTPRGSIVAAKVVHATNAYASALLPEMKSLITPTKAQALKLSIPPVGLESFPRLEASYSLRYLPEHFYSVAQRPDNSIVLGTSRGWTGMPKALQESLINNVDDSKPMDEVTVNAFSTFTKLFPDAGFDASGLKIGNIPDKDVEADKREAGIKGFDYAWSGIIGMTTDSVPFIGQIPGKPGQYIGAGFNGHGKWKMFPNPFPMLRNFDGFPVHRLLVGMARIFLCAPALAQIVLGEDFDNTNIPRAFGITAERMDKLKTIIKQVSSAAPEVEKKANSITLKELQEPLAAIDPLPSLSLGSKPNSGIAVKA